MGAVDQTHLEIVLLALNNLRIEARANGRYLGHGGRQAYARIAADHNEVGMSPHRLGHFRQQQSVGDNRHAIAERRRAGISQKPVDLRVKQRFAAKEPELRHGHDLSQRLDVLPKRLKVQKFWVEMWRSVITSGASKIAVLHKIDLDSWPA